MILITDDSKSMREIIKFTLTINGYQSYEACDGLEALKILQANKISLFLVDINMPNMGGLELISEIRKMSEYRFTPIIIITTETDTEKKQKAKNMGVSGWIIKPFTPETLLNVIRKFT